MDVLEEETIPRIRGRDISYEDFFFNFMAKNKPVILTDLMNEWRSVQDWKLENGTPNLSFLKKSFGSAIVQVTKIKYRKFFIFILLFSISFFFIY